jgi:hypothetical protein
MSMFSTGPEGRPLFILMGENHSDLLNLMVKTSLKYFTSRGQITHEELPQISIRSHLAPGSFLKFPGRVSLRGDRLAIADSGHHQILIVNITTGVIEFTIGTGDIGCMDGDLNASTFYSPQGLAWLDDIILYVADTENHVIRKVCFILEYPWPIIK